MRTIPALAALLLAAPAAASTWIVDDDAGPGVDFQTIAQAEAASSAGDVIVVRPGQYAGFVVDVGVAIVGDAGATITSLVTIQDVAAGPRVALAGFATRRVVVQGCAASVQLEDLVVAPIIADLADNSEQVRIHSSADVRLRGVRIESNAYGTVHGIVVHQSRVEVAQCVVRGTYGRSCHNYQFPQPPQDGGNGIVVTSGAIVRVAGSALRGGFGGSSPMEKLCSPHGGADGGAGLRMTANTNVIVSGVPSNLIEGGLQGEGISCSTDGEPGTGIFAAAGSALRLSGATPVGQAYYPGCGGNVPGVTGPYAQPPIVDPILTYAGVPQAGATLTYTITGAPGTRARLSVGRQLAVVDLPLADEDRLLVPLRSYDLGIVPASGTVSFALHVPTTMPRGSLVVAQGSTEATGGVTTPTHSLPITLR